MLAAKMAGRARKLPNWQTGGGTLRNLKKSNVVKESQKGCLRVKVPDDTMES